MLPMLSAALGTLGAPISFGLLLFVAVPVAPSSSP